MAYKKTEWKDTLRDSSGNVIQKGTPLNADALVKIEDGIVAAEQKIDTEIGKVTTQLAQMATKEEVTELVGNISNGTPLFAPNVSEMTDITRLYVNTTDGYIYIHNGTEFITTGKLYQSTGIADDAVTAEKAKFINKVPGDELIDTDINFLFVIEGALNPTTGVVNTGATTSLVSDYIDLSNVPFIFRYINDGLSDITNTAHTICFYDESKEFISGEGNITSAPNVLHNGKYGYKYANFPQGAKFARINVTKTVFSGSPSIKYNFVKVSYKSISYVLDENIEIKAVNELTAQLENGDINYKPLRGMKIAVFGDSIMEFGNIPETISQLSGATVYDCSVGGTRMARHTANTQGALYNELCMYRLANYINTGDYAGLTQATDSLKNNHNDDNTVNMNTLKSLDWSIIDIAIIAFGTNDYHGNNNAVTIGTDADLTSDGSSFKGAINYAIDQLLSKYPNLQIVFTTPIYRHRFSSAGDGLNSDIYANDKGLYLKDYSNAIKEVASLNHLPVIDLYSISGINKYTHKKYLNSDELHPSTSGYSLIGIKIAKNL